MRRAARRRSRYPCRPRRGSSVEEQRTHKPLVGSSNLPPATNLIVEHRRGLESSVLRSRPTLAGCPIRYARVRSSDRRRAAPARGPVAAAAAATGAEPMVATTGRPVGPATAAAGPVAAAPSAAAGAMGPATTAATGPVAAATARRPAATGTVGPAATGPVAAATARRPAATGAVGPAGSVATARRARTQPVAHGPAARMG
jgi:hypothetical protein